MSRLYILPKILDPNLTSSTGINSLIRASIIISTEYISATIIVVIGHVHPLLVLSHFGTLNDTIFLFHFLIVVGGISCIEILSSYPGVRKQACREDAKQGSIYCSASAIGKGCLGEDWLPSWVEPWVWWDHQQWEEATTRASYRKVSHDLSWQEACRTLPLKCLRCYKVWVVILFLYLLPNK